jgi:squalene synthase HpnC
MTAIAPPTPAVLPTQTAVMDQAERENFPVASAILGRRRQNHLLAIYGFARLVDDVGDEAAGDRGALLDLVQTELDRIYSGDQPEHAVMRTLAHTVAGCALPAAPFRRLLEANRQDQLVTRYETFDQLLAYCQLSAAPVGELVLHVFDAATPARIALSDRICAGLQVTEHLQDVWEDHARGRIYLPLEDLARFGCTEMDLPAQLPTVRGRALIEFEVRRARALLNDGAPLAPTLPLRPRLAVIGFVAGGRAALAALRAQRDHAPATQPGAIDASGRPGRRAFAQQFMRVAIGR